MKRTTILLSCLWAVSLAHAETGRPMESTQKPRANEMREEVLPPDSLFPVDLSGGPRGPRVQRRSVSAQLTTEPLPTWTFQAGTSGMDQATATAVCGEFLYTVGRTNGALPGRTHVGAMDVFLLKQKIKDGSIVWIEQFGSPLDDYAMGVAVHGCATGSTSIYVTGYTKGTLTGTAHMGTNQGGHDIFVRKYDASQALKWSRQRGSSNDDLSYAIAVNDSTGDVYVTGYTLGSFVPGTTASSNDVFVARYLADGSVATAIQLGSSSSRSDVARSISVDRNGKVYVAGYTNGVFATQTSVGGYDMFLMKYSANLATREWIRQLGTTSVDYAYGVVSSRNSSGEIEIYVVGQTFGSLSNGGTLGSTPLNNAGDYDAAVFQFNDSGTMKRAKLLGTQGRDSVNAIASDGGANLYVVGTTTHDLRSDPGAYVGSVDAFLAKFDVNLALKSVHQYDSTSEDPSRQNDTAMGVFADNDNGVYLAGYTEGNIGTASNQGGFDLFVMRYADGCSVDPALVGQCRSAIGSGDPHLTTGDRYKYDFQAVGEFILTESIPQASNPFVVQVRQKASGTRVALYSATVARFGTARVGVYARSTNPLMVNGTAVSLVVGDILPLVDGTRVLRPTASRYIIASPLGDRLIADNHTSFLNVTLILGPSRAGQVRGLLGNYNNVRADDFALRDGTALTPPLSFNQLYKNTPSFANSWRITQAESLFDYGQGESTTTFANLSLPSSTASTSQLTTTERQAAQQTCQAAGVTDDILLDDCILDVALTGDATFATGTAEAQAQQPLAQQVYRSQFQDGPGTEWNTAMTSMSPSGDRTFLGEFSNESAQLTLSALPAHNTITVTFDLFILQAWDGNGPFGPNYFGLKANGTEVYRTTFSNTSSSQFYPDSTTGTAHPAGTGASERNTLFYPDGDAVYKMSITFAHMSPDLALEFFADGLPGITNETWGLDKVEVKVK